MPVHERSSPALRGLRAVGVVVLLVVLLASAGIVGGCGGRPASSGAPAAQRAQPASNLPDLVGAWRWIRSHGGFAGIEESAESTGRSWRLELRPDSTYREVRGELSREGVPEREVAAGRYSVMRAPSLVLGRTVAVLRIEGTLERVVRRPAPDTLVLVEDVFDGFTHTFVSVPDSLK